MVFCFILSILSYIINLFFFILFSINQFINLSIYSFISTSLRYLIVFELSCFVLFHLSCLILSFLLLSYLAYFRVKFNNSITLKYSTISELSKVIKDANSVLKKNIFLLLFTYSYLKLLINNFALHIFNLIEGIGTMCVPQEPGQLKNYKHINTSHTYACLRKNLYLRPHLLTKCKLKNLLLGTRIIAFSF